MSGYITQIGVSKSGKYLFMGLDGDEYCSMWNVATQEIVQNLLHETRVSCLQVAPNGSSIATGCWDRMLLSRVLQIIDYFLAE